MRLTKITEKRGVTLAELSIVLALIAIVSTMIVSFSVMMRGYADRIAGYRTLQESATNYEDVFDFFVSSADVKDNHLTAKSDVRLRVETFGRVTSVTPIFPGDDGYGDCEERPVGDVLCVLNTEDKIFSWMLIYDGKVYAKFAGGTSTEIECKSFFDVRYLFTEQDGKTTDSHPLVRGMLSYEVPSASDQKETAILQILRATRATATYR